MFNLCNRKTCLIAYLAIGVASAGLYGYYVTFSSAFDFENRRRAASNTFKKKEAIDHHTLHKTANKYAKAISWPIDPKHVEVMNYYFPTRCWC